MSPLAALTLSSRGIDTPEKAQAFLNADSSLLHDPLLLRDMDRAVARIAKALAGGETMAVYGDYDVDGITSTCLLTHYLRSCGGRVIPYIPDRIEEGYGLNCEAIESISREGATLIITVDCGITAVDEVAYAKTLGVDLVITDHHACKAVLPDAVAVVNPHRKDCPYPCKHLAGVGVALKLALALGGANQQEAIFATYADLAAVGTIADVMTVVGENRTIIRMGLDAVQRTPRIGLHALLREVGLGDKPLTSMAVGYTVAPRINAAGRMGCAKVATELLLTENHSHCAQLARELCALNKERQEIELEIYQQCMDRASRLPPSQRQALILASEGWHQGVVGIVASRLAEKYACPTFMICLQDGKGKGSCRSYGGFNLFEALESCSDLLDGFGGHAMAAGFTILENQLPAFSQRMNQYVSAHTGGTEMITTLEVDADIEDVSLLTTAGVEGLDTLEPYGSGNPKPVLMLSGCTLVTLTEVGGGRHVKLRVSSGGATFDGIFFSATIHQLGVGIGERVDVAFTPQMNEYRGRSNVQLQVCDLRPARTRAQCEHDLYEKFQQGYTLTSQEAGAMLPSREDFATLWRYLKSHGSPIEDTAPRLARNLAKASGQRETLMRTMICLDVFAERGLLTITRNTDHLQIHLNPVQTKVDLEQSHIMCTLRRIMEE